MLQLLFLYINLAFDPCFLYMGVATLDLWALNFHLLAHGWLVGIRQMWIIDHSNLITCLEWLCTKYCEVNKLLFCHAKSEYRGLMGYGPLDDQHTSSIAPHNYLEVTHPHHLTTLIIPFHYLPICVVCLPC